MLIFSEFCNISQNFAEFFAESCQILIKIFRDFPKMQHFLKISEKCCKIAISVKNEARMKLVCMYQLPRTPPPPRPRTLSQSFPGAPRRSFCRPSRRRSRAISGSPPSRADAPSARAGVEGLVRVRRRMNIELNFPPNFEGLVLGCIDADFCK